MGYSTGDVAIGIDVMKCELPRGETTESYLSVLSGSVSDFDFYAYPILAFLILLYGFASLLRTKTGS